jgi:hypothetical protein
MCNRRRSRSLFERVRSNTDLRSLKYRRTSAQSMSKQLYVLEGAHGISLGPRERCGERRQPDPVASQPRKKEVTEFLEWILRRDRYR